MTEPQMPPPYPQQGPYGYPQQPGPGYAPPYGVGPYPPQNQFPPRFPPGPPVAGPPHAMLASQGARLGARALDAVILLVGLGLLGGITAGLQNAAGMDSPAAIVIAVIGYGALFVCLFGYEPFMLRRYGSTLGKRMCNVRVARLVDARNLSVGQALGRYWITLPMGFVPFLGILNVLWCCWDEPNRQCLHDKVVSSVAVKRQH